MKATWNLKGGPYVPGAICRVIRDDDRTQRGYVIRCPAGCDELRRFNAESTDLYSDDPVCDLTLERNIRFSCCGKAFSLVNGVFGEPR